MSAQIKKNQLLCAVSGWRLDPVVGLVWLLGDLWTRGAGSNSCLHQPSTAEQRVGLQWTGERNAGMSLFSLLRFRVYSLSSSPILHPLVFFFSWTIKHKTTQILSTHVNNTFPLLLSHQTTYAPGRPGQRVPGAAAQGRRPVIGCARARKRATQRVLVISRRRGTKRRRSCVTEGPVQVLKSRKRMSKVEGEVQCSNSVWGPKQSADLKKKIS